MVFRFDLLKRHPALLTLVVIIATGGSLAGWYICRLAAVNPDVSWDRRKNPEPWQEYDKKQYKLLAVGQDYKGVKPERPEF